jgi:decaprenylphospho-beta-D-erythro-pentofuranosid-2-ulose 2-reductase
MRDALGSVQSVLVLGGGSDIAIATVKALIDQRLRTVILAARSPERLQPLADELRRLGAREVDLVRFDADEPESHESIVNEVFDKHGDIDLVLVAAAVLGDVTVARDPKATAAILTTNVVGAASSLVASVNRLDSQGHGTVVLLSSVAAERVRKSNVAYGASKAAIDGFALGLADAMASSGVRLMVVRPGFVRSKMTEGLAPAPLSTTPEAVAAAILSGLRRNAAVVWVPSQLRWVMTAVRHLPRALFRRLPF